MLHANIKLPPSANGIFKTIMMGGKPVRAKTGPYKKWREEAARTMRASFGMTRLDGPIMVILNVDRPAINADLDNRLKTTIDALVHSGVLNDDKQVVSILAAWTQMRKRKECRADVYVGPATDVVAQLSPSEKGLGPWWADTI